MTAAQIAMLCRMDLWLDIQHSEPLASAMRMYPGGLTAIILAPGVRINSTSTIGDILRLREQQGKV